MQFSKKDIIAMSEGGFFGTGNAQLPRDNMLMIDEIHHISQEGGLFNRGTLKASFNIQPNHWFLSAISKTTLSCLDALVRMRTAFTTTWI